MEHQLAPFPTALRPPPAAGRTMVYLLLLTTYDMLAYHLVLEACITVWIGFVGTLRFAHVHDFDERIRRWDLHISMLVGHRIARIVLLAKFAHVRRWAFPICTIVAPSSRSNSLVHRRRSCGDRDLRRTWRRGIRVGDVLGDRAHAAGLRAHARRRDDAWMCARSIVFSFASACRCAVRIILDAFGVKVARGRVLGLRFGDLHHFLFERDRVAGRI